MNSFQKRKILKKQLRAKRVRARIFGTAQKPRAAVYRSLKYIYIQLIDDDRGKTIVSATEKELKKTEKEKKGIDRAVAVGKILAQKALSKKITHIVFDRRAYKFHGRVKALATGMREGGLKF